MGSPVLTFIQGGTAIFDGYFNLLNLGNWASHCDLDGLALRLRGRGRFAIRVWLETPKGRPNVILADTCVALSDRETEIDLARATAEMAETGHGAGLVMFTATALEDGSVTGGRFVTRVGDRPKPTLAIAITTFGREEMVAETASRVAAFMDSFENGGRLKLFVVDNGRSASIPAHPRVVYIPNANLGGAGGFARGLAEAQDGGFSHCLFMDDDASFMMENFVRTYAFLWLSRDRRTALAGAMISNARKWAMWENGAVFDRQCRPRFPGLDLRNPADVFRMEFETSRLAPENIYAGWWYFAFPIEAVSHFPFPFFVRGDDISFSLANDFDIATLSGVVSFQEDFSAKESSLTLYLDVRNHIVHHLAIPEMEIGPRALASVPLRFMLRNLARFHYETAEAILLAWEDVLRGPDFFAENADAQQRRKEISERREIEAWRPIDPRTAPDAGAHAPLPPRPARLLALTVNGHLLPFFRVFARRISLPIDHRGLLFPVWGSKEITYLDGRNQRGYVVRLDRPRGFRILLKGLRLAIRTKRMYPDLLSLYRTGYPRITTRDFWNGWFLPEASAPAALVRKEAG